MNQNAVTLFAALLFAAVSLAHLLRILFGVSVTVADFYVPMWISGVAVVVPGVLAWLLFRGSRK